MRWLGVLSSTNIQAQQGRQSRRNKGMRSVSPLYPVSLANHEQPTVTRVFGGEMISQSRMGALFLAASSASKVLEGSCQCFQGWRILLPA